MEPTPRPRRIVQPRRDTRNMLEDAAWLRSFHTPWDEVARRVGRSISSIAQAARRAGWDDLAGDASTEEGILRGLAA